MRRVSFFAPEGRVLPHCGLIGYHPTLVEDLQAVGRFLIVLAAGATLLAVIAILYVGSRLSRR